MSDLTICPMNGGDSHVLIPGEAISEYEHRLNMSCQECGSNFALYADLLDVPIHLDMMDKIHGIELRASNAEATRNAQKPIIMIDGQSMVHCHTDDHGIGEHLLQARCESPELYEFVVGSS